MTFLNGAILAALTLGLLPILIHLLNRQRFKKVDFPTLRFLRELQRQKMRQVRIRQIILLALRTLAVLFLVLAVARPVVKSAAGILPGADARTTAVLILDRSASMQTETPDGTRFRQVQARAHEVLGLLRDGDDAQIVWADDPPEVFPEAPTAQTALLREAVSEAAPSECGGDLVKAVVAARQILGRSQNLHKEVYVLSDFGGSAWPERLPEAALLPSDVRVFLMPASGGGARNVGIREASVTSRIITPGRPVEVGFTVVNTGAVAIADRIVAVHLGGRRVAQTRVTLAPGEVRSQRVKFVPQDPGDQVGTVRIEEADDLAADDERSFVLRVPARLTVAVAGEDGAARALTTLALNPSGDPDAFVNVRVMTPDALESADWSTLDAIFIVDGSAFSSVFASRLRTFVENGQGVLAVIGPQSDLRASSNWLTVLGLPAPSEIWQAGDAPVKWSTVDYQHPLFEGLFEERPGDISPDIMRCARVTSSGTAVEIISAAGGLPFLLESRAGRGRALLMTSSPDPSWSTIYRSGVFAPLLVSSAAYLSGIGTSGAEFELTAGVPAEIAFSGVPGEEKFELRGQQTLSPAVESTPSGFRVKLAGLAVPGGYELWQGTRRFAAIAVNVPARESLLAAVPEESYRNLIGGQATLVGERTSALSSITEGRFGRELWKLCLFIALATLLAEMAIGRVGRRDAAVT